MISTDAYCGKLRNPRHLKKSKTKTHKQKTKEPTPYHRAAPEVWGWLFCFFGFLFVLFVCFFGFLRSCTGTRLSAESTCLLGIWCSRRARGSWFLSRRRRHCFPWRVIDVSPSCRSSLDARRDTSKTSLTLAHDAHVTALLRPCIMRSVMA